MAWGASDASDIFHHAVVAWPADARTFSAAPLCRGQEMLGRFPPRGLGLFCRGDGENQLEDPFHLLVAEEVKLDLPRAALALGDPDARADRAL